ncbi:MAG: helix-turn-helix domain-containing protein [candidate division KSB1 bacterium]|nr:helix-turn-helix domain-containing protein [candidate division KSB1 bacterium]MDZ7303990.1 helix-turn-helix domain-containing protein [candidate division KSB1 bacterium]MDZ7313300.1 helix-turn-helix domain-containing protein [candidate division KSB1 bacterium]
MNDIKKQFGARLRSLRVQKGLTLEDLADLSGLHSTYIGSVERGERNISLEAIERLAKGLQVEIFELFLLNSENALENKAEDFLKEIKILSASLNKREKKFVLSLIKAVALGLRDFKK